MAGSEPLYNWIYWLVGIGLITTVFALYYYANVIKAMFFYRDTSPYHIKLSPPAMTVIVVGLAGVFIFGLFPEPILKLASYITMTFGLMPF